MEQKNISEIRRKNAKLYPIYKMFSWDLLFFYSIEFLFSTITKQVSVSDLLIISGLYMIFRVVEQIPAVAIIETLGKRKSIILGNVLLIFFILALVFIPGAISIIIANLIFALAANIKNIAGPNLLYDSVATKGGDGLYTKLEAKGESWYFLLDGLASLVAGYLFVVDNYLPVYICLGFIIISTILSFGFHDIYPIKKNKKEHLIEKYKKDLKKSFGFIINSKRMKAFILFGAIFYGIIQVVETYQGNLLVDIGISPEYFSIIFAILTLIRGISLTFEKQIEKTFKNRTLTFISLIHIFSIIITGIISSYYTANIATGIILILCSLQQIISAIWYILEAKYLKNFTTFEMRNRLSFTYEFIVGIIGSMIAIFGAILLDYFTFSNSFIIFGLIFLAVIVLTLDYMRTRFGLKSSEYKKQDIEF